jgi:glycogen operon protein
MVPELASRLSGSADIFGDHPNRSINFITCHDGFSLHDLVSYDHKHNEANAEDSRDGHGENYSRNWGVEGPTTTEEVLEMRERVKRSLFATLMLSQGVPMLSAGDELGRTQHGNNNAYCQDNELSWLDWNLGSSERDLLEFSRVLMRLHREHPVLRRRSFFGVHRDPREEVIWLRPDGEDMTEDDWNRSGLHTLGMLLHGEAGDEQDERGRPVVGETLLLMMNGGNRPRRFTLPEAEGWVVILDTARNGLERTHPATRMVRRRTLRVLAHSLMLLVRNADR